MALTLDEREAFDTREFLDQVQLGVSPLHAAIEVGWSIAALKRRMQDPEFAEMVADATDVANSKVETSLWQSAVIGRNVKAMELWLFNRMPERWSDRRKVEVTGVTVNIGAINNIREAVLGMLRDDTDGALAALAPGGVIDTQESDAADPV